MLAVYLARHGFFTVEMGIAAAAITGFILILAGWRFRKKRPLYFLILQGGGIGILYLSVFAAYKLIPWFPAGLTVVLMSALIPLAVILALFQNSQPLAFFAFLGGFAAPLLLASGGRGNHVFFFTYYTVLNAGVLAIGFCRFWKGINLLAFGCTFGVSVWWVMNVYSPSLFWTVEPFLFVFIVLFTVLGLRSVKSREYKLESRGDGTLILGTPLAAALLQWKVFSFIEHGSALISLIFSALYLLLAVILFGRKKEALRLYAEGYLGLALLLANFAVPLELSPRITGAVWAAEGAFVFFYGLRRKKRSGAVFPVGAGLHYRRYGGEPHL
jgi:uncharacterized membrane protein